MQKINSEILKKELFINGRAFNQVRPIDLKYDAFGFASSSVLFSIGKTKVLVAISLQDGVPRFLRGQKQGWLTAEYAMLPCATKRRTIRDGSQGYKNSRSVEISRIIGRSVRSVVNLSSIGEKTITIDCDVLQADGGTRVACITAASIALKLAQNRWMQDGKIKTSILKEEFAAISVGIIKGQPVLDLDFYLDSNADVDFNFVMTRSGKIIEIQGTAEKEPLSFELFEELKKLALTGIDQLFNVVDKDQKLKDEISTKDEDINIPKTPIFSLGNRINISQK